MRYKTGRTEIARRRIIAVALEKFREKGIHAAGLKDLLASAGVKQGSFYNYFASKEQLVQEALICDLERYREACAAALGAGGSGIEAEVRRCLCAESLDDAENAGVLPVVAPEIARQSEPTRCAVERKLDQIFQLLANHLPVQRIRSRRVEAIAILSLMIGALQLSRVVVDRKLALEILESAREIILELV